MALLDKERNIIVIRVVYDGPPEAGKTTSLRALATSLGRKLHTPEEQDGRTLYFDWLDYTGGRFEGYQIRCQIISVPGQRKLARRRHQLLRDADVIVCVADSGEANIEGTVRHLRELPAILVDLPQPPVGVVLQANKRDLPDAVPMQDIHEYLDDAGLRVGVVESIAAEGSGIRETFVFAVRLALDRVRELLRSQTLLSGRPEIDDAEALLASMQAAEQHIDAIAAERAPAETSPETSPETPETPSVVGPWEDPTEAPPTLARLLEENELVSTAHAQRHSADGGGDNGSSPRPPNPAVPSGSIWPPVEGRLILHAASTAGMHRPQRLSNGAWIAGLGSGWRTYSHADAGYGTLDHGRAALIRWARLHTMYSELLSARRSIVLAEAGDNSWRLWQIVRAERSLSDSLEGAQGDPFREVSTKLLAVAASMIQMSVKLERAECGLPCTLDMVTIGERGPIYLGLAPLQALDAESAAERETTMNAQLERLLGYVALERRDELRAMISRHVRVALRGKVSAFLQ